MTKDVNGKRVALTRNEMLSILGNKPGNNSYNNLNREAHRVRKFIRVCKLILLNVNNAKPGVRRNKVNNVKPVRVNNRNRNRNNNKKKNAPRAVPPPPPPPPRPPVAPRAPPPPPSMNPRNALMANLKANLKRRGLSNN